MFKGPKYQRGIIGMAAAGTTVSQKSIAGDPAGGPPPATGDGYAATLLFNFEPTDIGGSPAYGSPTGYFEEVDNWPAQFRQSARLSSDQVKFGTHSYRGFGNNGSTTASSGDGIYFPNTLGGGSPIIQPELEFGSNDWTMEGWVRFDSLPENNSEGYALLSKYFRSSPGGQETNWLVWFNGTSTSPANRLSFTWSTNGQTTGLITERATVNPSTNTWYHWGIQRRGNDLEFLWDGQLRNRVIDEFTAGGGSIFNEQYAPLAIGCLYQVALASRKRALDGWMDSTRIIIGQTVYNPTGSPPTLTGSPETYTIPTAAFVAQA